MKRPIRHKCNSDHDYFLQIEEYCDRLEEKLSHPPQTDEIPDIDLREIYYDGNFVKIPLELWSEITEYFSQALNKTGSDTTHLQ